MPYYERSPYLPAWREGALNRSALIRYPHTPNTCLEPNLPRRAFKSLGSSFASLLSRTHTPAEMSGVQTRKQKMMEAESSANGDILANGHAKLNGTITRAEKTTYKQENIFVFIPNLIGRLLYLCLQSLERSLTWDLRLLTRLSRHSVPLLHAPPSANLLRPVQHILPARCARRIRRTSLQPSHYFRRCT